MADSLQHDPAVGAASPAPDDPWLNVDGSAKHGKVSPKTIYAAINSGRLRHARVNARRSIRIRRSWVDAWLEETTTPIEVVRGSTLRVAK